MQSMHSFQLVLPLVLILTGTVRANWVSRYHSGIKMLKSADVEQARQELTAALKEAEANGIRGRELGAIVSALGRAEFEAGRYRTALKRYNRSVGLLESSPEEQAAALSNAGSAALALRDSARAERFFRQALELSPDNVTVVYLLGRALFLQRRYTDAESYERRAIELGDVSDSLSAALARNELSLIYEAQNRNAESMELLNAAISAVPAGRMHAAMIANLGVMEWKLGMKREAAAHLLQSLREAEKAVGPQHPDVGNVLAFYALVLQKTGEKVLAKEVAARAAAIRGAFQAETNSSGATVDWLDLK